MNKKNVFISFILGIVMVIITAAVGFLSSLEDPSWWVYVILFLIPFCADYIWQKAKEYVPYKDWYKSWKKLKNSEKYDKIRISFSYLFRIKIDDKYLLVKNSHGTKLFQPVGGVYKYNSNAKPILRKLGAIEDSGKVIKMDPTTKHDFRLRVETKKLPRFVKWFQKGELRETVCDLSREFSEELIESGILSKDIFRQIEYTYIGQHISDICSAKFDRNVNELFIADILEINLSPEQYKTIKGLQCQDSDKYCFATEQMISSNKTQCGPDNNIIDIADHTFKILEVTEAELDRRKHQKYAVAIVM